MRIKNNNMYLYYDEFQGYTWTRDSTKIISFSRTKALMLVDMCGGTICHDEGIMEAWWEEFTTNSGEKVTSQVLESDRFFICFYHKTYESRVMFTDHFEHIQAQGLVDGEIFYCDKF